MSANRSVSRPANRPARRLLLPLLLFAATAAAQQQRFRETHPAMGTIFTLDIYADDEASAARLAAQAFDTVDRIEDELSNYKATSELSRIMREAPHAPVTTDPETFSFLTRSVAFSRASHGAFDITVGPLLRAWGFFFHAGRVPSSAQLAALRNRIGWQNILLSPATRSVRFRNGLALELDPGSIGKGFAVDRVVTELRAEGVRSAFLSAGGSTVYAIGAPPGEAGWPVLVPDPRHPNTTASTVLLRDTSLSTGACTQKFFIKNGHRYCHIFDPRTLRPVEGMLQTTVIDPSATDSDALSTVAFVLTPQQSRRFFAARAQTGTLIFSQLHASQSLAIQPRADSGCLAIHWPGDACSSAPATSRKAQP